MSRRVKTLQEKIREAKFRVLELEEAYHTQRYLETMPEHDPTYKYCYGTSNFKIPYPEQSLDSWLRAVIKHMAGRRPGHGGSITDAIVVSIPTLRTEAGIERWIEYVTQQLGKKAKARKRHFEAK